jgi:hypothetical protein
MKFIILSLATFVKLGSTRISCLDDESFIASTATHYQDFSGTYLTFASSSFDTTPYVTIRIASGASGQ